VPKLCTMDRNTIIGILLITGLLIGYSVLMKPSEAQIREMKRQQDSLDRVRTEVVAGQATLGAASASDVVSAADSLTQTGDSLSLEDTAMVRASGAFAPATIGANEWITLENSVMKVIFSTRGGRPWSVELKDYKRYDGSPLILFSGDSTVFGLNFFAQNRQVSTNELFFTPVGNQRHITVERDSSSLVMRVYASEDAYIEYVYTMYPGEYMLGFDVRMSGMDQVIARNINSLDFQWQQFSPRQEKGAENENNYTAIYYKFLNDDVEDFSAAKDLVEEHIINKTSWVAFKQQFFSSVLISGKGFESSQLRQEKLPDQSSHIKFYSAGLTLAYDARVREQVLPFSLYFGPNHFQTLRKHGQDLEKLVPLGGSMIRWFNRYLVIPVFNWLNTFISSYGIIILILTIIVKIILLPLTYKSYLSMAKMKVVKPFVDEVTKKIPADKAMEKQQATMNLYKKAGINPMGGCLPLLVQMPVLFALFRFFPSSIELRQEGFLWATDLSTYDSILTLPFEIPFYGDHVSLFTILMTAVTYISMKMTSGQENTAMPGMKTMMYMMPVMFMVFLNNFSSGLTYYYFLANVITIAQNYTFKKFFVNEQEIIRKIQLATSGKGAKEPVKKSAFQKKLEEMAKKKGYKPSR